MYFAPRPGKLGARHMCCGVVWGGTANTQAENYRAYIYELQNRFPPKNVNNIKQLQLTLERIIRGLF